MSEQGPEYQAQSGSFDPLAQIEQVAATRWQETASAKERAIECCRAWLAANDHPGWKIAGACAHTLPDGSTIFVIHELMTVGFKPIPDGPTFAYTMPSHDIVLQRGDTFEVIPPDDEGKDDDESAEGADDGDGDE
jgi:hypothetical protein